MCCASVLKKYRQWIAICKYPDKEEFYFSAHFFTDHTVGEETAWQEAIKKVKQAWAEISPHEPPELTGVQQGQLLVCYE